MTQPYISTGFYFGGTLIDYNSLKHAVLYYDKVIHYDVKKFFQDAIYINKDLVKDPIKKYRKLIIPILDSFYQKSKIYVENGLLKFIDLNELTPKYGNLMEDLVKQFNLDKDENPVYKSGFTRRLVRSVIPRLIVLYQFGKFYPRAFPFKQSILKEKDNSVYQYPIYYKDDARFIEPIHKQLPFFDPLDYSILAIGRELSYGLLGGIEFNAIPFTDHNSYREFFNYFLGLLATKVINHSPSSDPLKKYFHTNYIHSKTKIKEETYNLTAEFQSILEKNKKILPKNYVDYIKSIIEDNRLLKMALIDEILEIEVPAFSEISDEQLIELRDDEKKTFINFHSKINDLANTLNNNKYNDNFKLKIKELIKSKISPCIKDLNNAFKNARKDLKKKTVQNVILTSASLSAYLFIPFSILILPLLIYTGGKTLSDKLSYLIEKSEMKKNSFYFLWKMKSLRR